MREPGRIEARRRLAVVIALQTMSARPIASPEPFWQAAAASGKAPPPPVSRYFLAQVWAGNGRPPKKN